MIRQAVIIIILVFLSVPLNRSVGSVETKQVLKVYYFHRPPYYMKLNDGNASGFLVEITRMIFNAAEIPFVFVDIPPKRILKNIAQVEYSCAVGWFKTAERETFARFSDPIYQDMPVKIILRRSSSSMFSEKPALTEILGSGLMLGVIDGFSYGSVVDEAIFRLKPSMYAISNEAEKLVKMIQSERIDYAFMTPEEANYILQKDSAMKAELLIMEMADELIGNSRYLIFSTGVEPEIVDRVNKSIKIVKKTKKYSDLIKFEVP